MKAWPLPPSDPNPVEKSAADFGRRVRGLARGVWAGEIDWLAFGDSMAWAIYRGYEQAWVEGAARCGIRPEERSDRERIVLQREIVEDNQRIRGFADYLQAHTKALGFKLSTVLSRAEIWTNRYTAIVTLAQVTACADRKMVWYLGRTEKHCTDCFTYEGHVYRASIWTKYGALPQSRRLECGGWRCDCRLVPTDAPVTPGHPHYPKGGR